MPVVYLDTSAAMKLLVDEAESAALAQMLDEQDRHVVASFLLHTELHCAAGRHPDVVDVDLVNQTLAAVELFDVTRGDLIGSGTRSPLRSHDAIHLEVALRLGVDELATYDNELSDAARRAGLVVLAPN
ncbi:MAG: type II toxin-antitoxin system VapC family toxin [Acidimicrobiales bacterium]|nr:type II toxin-antitoxin system VapC family toxin [Acidimicrobiales bacterium]